MPNNYNHNSPKDKQKIRETNDFLESFLKKNSLNERSRGSTRGSNPNRSPSTPK